MDEIDDLLTPRSAPIARSADALILQQASRVLRGRRWTRHVRRSLALAACFAAGALAVWLSSPRRIPEPVVVERIVEVPTPAREPIPSQPVDPYRNDPPDRIERWAGLAEGEKRVALYRRAGDLFLECGDDLAAIRCYRRALNAGTRADLVVRPDQDTWLLMSMKFARQKEKTDARN